MASRYSVLAVNGDGISTVSDAAQPPKSDSISRTLEDARRRPVTAATLSSVLLPRSSESRLGACSIPSGRSSRTPTIICNGRGCLEAELLEEQVARPRADNTGRKRLSYRLSTPLRSSHITNDDTRLHPQPRYIYPVAKLLWVPWCGSSSVWEGLRTVPVSLHVWSAWDISPEHFKSFFTIRECSVVMFSISHVCVSVCLSVSDVVTFESLDLQSSVLVCR